MRPIFLCQRDEDHLLKYLEIFGRPNTDTFPELLEYPYYGKYEELFTCATGDAVPLHIAYPELPPDALDLLGKMLHWNPAERWHGEQILAHPYFNQVR
jgi:hypothetical protein